MTTLDKIKAEIRKMLDRERDFTSENARAQALALFWVLELIDKYAEQEPCDDVVSREEEIKKLKEQPAKVYIDKTDYQQGYIDGVNQMVKELKAERQPRDDAISREDALEALNTINGTAELDKAFEVIEKLPSVRPQEQTGHWINICNDEWICSECGEVITTEGSWDKPADKYCKGCGAKMFEPQEGAIRNDKI